MTPKPKWDTLTAEIGDDGFQLTGNGSAINRDASTKAELGIWSALLNALRGGQHAEEYARYAAAITARETELAKLEADLSQIPTRREQLIDVGDDKKLAALTREEAELTLARTNAASILATLHKKIAAARTQTERRLAAAGTALQQATLIAYENTLRQLTAQVFAKCADEIQELVAVLLSISKLRQHSLGDALARTLLAEMCPPLPTVQRSGVGEMMPHTFTDKDGNTVKELYPPSPLQQDLIARTRELEGRAMRAEASTGR